MQQPQKRVSSIPNLNLKKCQPQKQQKTAQQVIHDLQATIQHQRNWLAIKDTTIQHQQNRLAIKDTTISELEKKLHQAEYAKEDFQKKVEQQSKELQELKTIVSRLPQKVLAPISTSQSLTKIIRYPSSHGEFLKFRSYQLQGQKLSDYLFGFSLYIQEKNKKNKKHLYWRSSRKINRQWHHVHISIAFDYTTLPENLFSIAHRKIAIYILKHQLPSNPFPTEKDAGEEIFPLLYQIADISDTTTPRESKNYAK